MSLFSTISSTFLNICFLFGILLIAFNVQELKNIIEYHNSSFPSPSFIPEERRRVAWIDGHGKEPLSTYLVHIADVFWMMGYDIITGDQKDDVVWDVMWIHDFSLNNPKYRKHIERAGPHKLVNHIPGSGFYTSKVFLATAGLSIGVPQAFQLPSEQEEFLKFAKENTELLWVQKDNSHRNIQIRNLENLDLDKPDSFIQRFVENPLLIDNRKFDIGIYTVVTSLSPLKVYLYNGDVLIRFCPEDYHPFDVENVNKYVVGDDYTPIWEIDSLSHFYNDQKMSARDAFDSYLKSKREDPMKIWTQIGKTIAEVFQRKQSNMLVSQSGISTQAKLFELSRFDFVVDDKLNVYIMEANMSPNLSTGHFKQNQLLYEQVIMSVLSLVGVGSQLTKEADSLIRSRQPDTNPLVSERDIRVMMDICWDGSCKECDLKMECQLCGHCMTEDTSTYLKQTYLEHINRRKMVRLHFDYETIKPLTVRDHLLQTWLSAKCKEDPDWC